MQTLTATAALAALLALTPALAQQPPAGAMKLSEIIAKLEAANYVVTEVEFEVDEWEIEAYKGEEEVEFEVDPMTGEWEVDD